MRIHQMEEYLATAVSKIVTKMLRHYDQEERQTDGSMHWYTIRPVFLRAFAQEGARDFDEGFWLYLIHEGSNKKDSNTAKITMGLYVFYELSKDTLVVFQQVQN